jgi:hypothetical protein
MVEFMIAGIPFLFQTMEGTVYLVQESITVVNSWLGRRIVAFCDADGLSSRPSQFILESHNIQIIAACPPKGASERWMEEMAGMCHVMKYVTTLWSPQELLSVGCDSSTGLGIALIYLFRIFLHPEDLLYSRLQESTTYFDLNPCKCFFASASPENLVRLRENIRKKVQAISLKPDLYRTLCRQTFPHEPLFDSVFYLFPKNDMRLYDEAEVAAVSSWALDVFLNACEGRQPGVAFQFYKWIIINPDAATLEGQMFKRQVLRYFGSLKGAEWFTIRSLADSTTSQWMYPGPTEVSSRQSFTATRLLHDAVAHNMPLHLVSQDRNFPSILYNPGEALAGIQFATQTEHPVAVVGLERMQAWLKRSDTLLDLQPSISGNHLRLIFVVPDNVATRFMIQPFIGDTGAQGWSQKVDQYVLGVKEEMIWAAR